MYFNENLLYVSIIHIIHMLQRMHDVCVSTKDYYTFQRIHNVCVSTKYLYKFQLWTKKID